MWAELCVMLVTAIASEGSSAIIFSVKIWHFKGDLLCRSSGSSVGCKSLQLVKWNALGSTYVVLETFLLSTNIYVALS